MEHAGPKRRGSEGTLPRGPVSWEGPGETTFFKMYIDYRNNL